VLVNGLGDIGGYLEQPTTRVALVLFVAMGRATTDREELAGGRGVDVRNDNGCEHIFSKIYGKGGRTFATDISMGRSGDGITYVFDINKGCVGGVIRWIVYT